VLPPRFDNEIDRELLVLVVDDGGGGDVLLSYHCFMCCYPIIVSRVLQ